MHLAALEVLSPDEIRQIHEATLRLLAHTGVRVLGKPLLDFLESRGLPVDRERQIVRFPQSVLEDALSTVPRQFEVCDREGQPAFMLGDGTPRIAAGHNAVFWVDSETGETRPSTVADVAQFSRLCEQLPHIDMIGLPVMPQDVASRRGTVVYGLQAVMENSRKPLFFSTESHAVNHACLEMLAAVCPADLHEQAYGISQLSPTSPLYWEEGVCEAIMDTVRTGVPLAILPEPNAGVSAPLTLAGLLTVNNAECLSGLAMIQLLNPGHKVLYANSWTTTDMRTGAALVGSVETTVCRIAGTQLAKFYQVPCHTTAPNSDNHAHDEQNAWEKTLSQFCALGAGTDLLVNCGMFATGMTCSHEQLLMDEEISALSRRLAAGIRVEEDTIAEQLIADLGPQNAGYLTADHTFRWLRSDEYHVPRLAVRGPRSSWEAAGAKDTYALAREQAAQLAANHPAPLEEERRARLAETVEVGLRGLS